MRVVLSCGCRCRYLRGGDNRFVDAVVVDIFMGGGYPQQTVVVIIIGVVVTPSWLSFVVVVFL